MPWKTPGHMANRDTISTRARRITRCKYTCGAQAMISRSRAGDQSKSSLALASSRLILVHTGISETVIDLMTGMYEGHSRNTRLGSSQVFPVHAHHCLVRPATFPTFISSNYHLLSRPWLIRRALPAYLARDQLCRPI